MKKKSIGARVAFGVVAGIVVACGLLLALSGTFGSQILKKMVEDEVLNLTKEVARAVDDKLTAEGKIVETLAANPILTQSSHSFTQKSEYMQKQASRLGYVEFFISTVKGEGKNFTKGQEDFDASDREYFKESMTGKTFISDILIDKVTEKGIIVISTPIYQNDKIVGVFGAVKSADFISNICSEFSWLESGIVSIYDMRGQVIGHTNPKLVEEKLNILEKAEQDSSYQKLANFYKEKILTQKTGAGEYSFMGNDKLAGFYNMEIKDWTVLISINKAEIMKPQNDLALLMALFALGVIILLSIVLHFVLSRPLIKALNDARANIEQLARLEIGKELPHDYSDRKNEFGDIYRAIVSLRQNISELVHQIHSSIDKLMSSSKDFSQSCNSASAMAADITRTLDEIAQGATAQASDVQDGVAELSHMGVQMESNTVQMKEMIGASDRVDLLQVEGKGQLQLLVDSTKQNTEISAKIQEAIKNTEQSVDEINLAGDTIKTISDQINLLALNAAIEAARAGESGRGFAVVAEEIRKLAESSNLSTEQIRKSVVTLAERTQYAVSQIIESNRVVEEQSENVTGMSEKFEGISEALGHLRNTIEKIFAANEKINEAREKVSSSMSNIAALTEENAASTEEISASMQEQNDTFLMIAAESEALLELGEDLERISSEFKL